jgi:nucleoid DNA-binding protein
MDITAFIRELLFSHDCVIVPGFGGFIGNYTPARIDKSSSTFYPPVKKISFNRNLNHNDGLLVGKVSEYSKVNYGDSRNLVDEFVAVMRKKLEKGEKVVFDHIGSFTNNQEGNVQFEPESNVNYYLDSYGLESFQFPPLEGYDVRKRISRHIDREPVRHSSMRKILWRAAVVVPFLALMVISLKTDFFKSKAETTTLNPLATAEFENNRKAVEETVVIPPAIIAGNIIKPETSTPTAGLSEAKEELVYCLITGSFRSKENAETQANILKEEGYTPEIIDGPNGFYRVSAIKCSNLDSALGKKDSIATQFPGTWVKKI